MEPDPTIGSFPMVMPYVTVAPAPIQLCSPIRTRSSRPSSQIQGQVFHVEGTMP